MVILFLLSLIMMAQIKMPKLSPTFELNGVVGFAEIKVVYSRPSARGRQVADNLIPYNEVWRTGANASTKVSFSEEVELNGNLVPSGDYALYSIFMEEKATIILSKNISWWGAFDYDPVDDFLRFDVPIKHSIDHYETFTISFSDFTRNTANLNLNWGNTKVMFKIESDEDEKVMADIKAQVIDGSSATLRSYWDAASYYYDTNRDSKIALEWINKVIKERENEGYWDFHLKAKLLARLGRKQDAINAAKKSIVLAKENQNPDYVRLNQQLIASLK